jgi:glycosyltransferase involved in cell wall biosynthesis
MTGEKMNVLFLTLAYPADETGRNIYSDLMQEFRDHGNSVYVVCQRERRCGKPTEFGIENGINVLRVRTGNVTKTNIFEKGISTILLEEQFNRSIKKHLADINFDLVIYSTPPITFERVIKDIKKHNKCISYLLLKDIFPQNAVDIGMMKKESVIWRYFREKEKRLYDISDYIGCMSKANVEYLLRHNPEIAGERTEVCPNSIRPAALSDCSERLLNIRERYAIPGDAVIFNYGGNLGRPQGIDFLLEVLKNIKGRADIFFLITGSGTEYSRLEQYINNCRQNNVKLMKYLPKADYDILLRCCDVGLIFLDRRFTIPNFPSRLTAYMEAAIPVLAATDVNSDIKDVLFEAGCGFWAESGDLDNFIGLADKLAGDGNMRRQMGHNGRKYLEKYFTAARGYDIITAHLK